LPTPETSPSFNEPAGITAAAGKLFVADTNNHLIRVIELPASLRQSGTGQGSDTARRSGTGVFSGTGVSPVAAAAKVSTLSIPGLKPPAPARAPAVAVP
jgi:hypothetical protein